MKILNNKFILFFNEKLSEELYSQLNLKSSVEPNIKIFTEL